MANKKYIVGTHPVPDWARKIMIPYKKADGTCGIEIFASQRTFTANIGDEITLLDKGYIDIKKKKE